MVGLSVVLEAQKNGVIRKKITMIINNKPSSPPPPPSRRNYFQYSSFLDQCFLCKQKLLAGKDIYMYRGEKAFCSVECRCRQIFMDEEESLGRSDNCSMAAMKPTSASSSSTSSSSSSSSSASRHGKGSRNRGGGFAY